MAKLLASVYTKTAPLFIWIVLFMLERENQNLSAENLSPICHCLTSYLLKPLHQHQCYLQLLSYTLQNSINHQPNPYPTCYRLSSEIPSCQISIFPCFASQAFILAVTCSISHPPYSHSYIQLLQPCMPLLCSSYFHCQ